jgi:four helix bundle suffix protein
MQMENKTTQVLRKQADWENLYFYQKSNVLYQLTFVFTKRFLTRGDRTVDQMVQAARSGKQNIVEGSADGVTSMEMELKLLNVARSSIKELKEDYMDYLASRHLQRWEPGHKRYDGMLKFCRTHNKVEDYQDYFEKWTDEEMANTALTLCHMVDKMMTTYQRQQEELFVKEGGIKERMTAARLGYRTNQREEIERLTRELAAANRQIADLETKLAKKDRKN